MNYLHRLSGVVLVAALALVVTAHAAAALVGDCNRDGTVTIDEIITVENIALNMLPLSTCQLADASGDGQVMIDEVISAVNAALDGGLITPTPVGTPTPTATDTATVPVPTPANTSTDTVTSTPTATPTDTQTVTPTWSLTATATPTASWTVTPTPTRSPTLPPAEPLAVKGTCKYTHPGATTLVQCAQGTHVTVSRCDDPAICLANAAGRTALSTVDAANPNPGSVNAAGAFDVVVDQRDLQGKMLHVEAEVTGGVIYRTLSPGHIGSGNGGRVAAARAGFRTPVLADVTGADEIDVIIDPSSEGAVRAFDTAGLENVSDEDVNDLPIQVRADLHANYAGLSAAAAAETAQGVAFDLFFINASLVAVSPDGRHVYAASKQDNALAVFARNSVSNTLSFLQVLQDHVGGVNGLKNPTAIAISPDGLFVYVASKDDGAIAILDRDTETGRLHFREAASLALFTSFSALAISPDGTSLYALGSLECGSSYPNLFVFRRTITTGSLSLVVTESVEGAYSVLVSPDSLHVYVARNCFVPACGCSGGGIVVFARDSNDGSLTFVEVQDSSTGDLQGNTLVLSQSAAGLTLSQDGQHVYVVGHAVDQSEYQQGILDGTLFVFARDAMTGRLHLERTAPGPVRADATAVNGAYLYIGVAFNSSATGIAVFGQNTAPNPFGFVELEPNGEVGQDQRFFPITLAIPADGTSVYTGGPSITTELGKPGGIAVLDRDGASGTLTFHGLVSPPLRRAPLRGVRSLAISPDGDDVYTAGGDAAVAAFQRDAVSGLLQLTDMDRLGNVGGQFFDPGVASVSPDGAHVYVSPNSSVLLTQDPLVGFVRNLATGSLDFLQMPTVSLPVAFVTQAVAFSPNGEHVYVGGLIAGQGGFRGAVVVLARNLQSGILSLIDFLSLDGQVASLSVSPDGKHVYVGLSHAGTTMSNTEIQVFERNPLTGAVSPATTLVVEPTSSGYAEVVVSSDGNSVYFSDPLMVFQRDAETGALTPVQQVNPGALKIVLSPDGRHLYGIGGGLQTAVNVYSRDATHQGQLALLQQLSGIEALQGLGSSQSTAISGDGAHLYVSDSYNSAIVILGRDKATGLLTYLATKR